MPNHRRLQTGETGQVRFNSISLRGFDHLDGWQSADHRKICKKAGVEGALPWWMRAWYQKDGLFGLGMPQLSNAFFRACGSDPTSTVESLWGSRVLGDGSLTSKALQQKAWGVRGGGGMGGPLSKIQVVPSQPAPPKKSEVEMHWATWRICQIGTTKAPCTWIFGSLGHVWIFGSTRSKQGRSVCANHRKTTAQNPRRGRSLGVPGSSPGAFAVDTFWRDEKAIRFRDGSWFFPPSLDPACDRQDGDGLIKTHQ